MRFNPRDPIIWRVALASAPSDVFALLDTDEGRERFWAQSSKATDNGFELEFTGGLREHVTVLQREPPTRMRIRYFGAEADFALTGSDDGGCIFEVTCHCDDVAEWMEFFAGWVSWLLTLKAAADFDVDLRNNSPERTWSDLFVDP